MALLTSRETPFLTRLHLKWVRRPSSGSLYTHDDDVGLPLLSEGVMHDADDASPWDLHTIVRLVPSREEQDAVKIHDDFTAVVVNHAIDRGRVAHDWHVSSRSINGWLRAGLATSAYSRLS